jgi:hypothetical protein
LHCIEIEIFGKCAETTVNEYLNSLMAFLMKLKEFIGKHCKVSAFYKFSHFLPFMKLFCLLPFPFTRSGQSHELI